MMRGSAVGWTSNRAPVVGRPGMEVVTGVVGLRYGASDRGDR